MRSLKLLTGLLVTTARASIPPRDKHPQIISHRGACGYLPEHSLNAYQLAIDLGTDYIEPDLIASKDGVLIDMHDLTLDATTDIAAHPEFADRKTTKMVSGSNMTGFFAIDFTFAELQTLTVRQRNSGRTKMFDGYFKIPQLDDILDLVLTQYEKSKSTIGLFPEIKDPDFHYANGFDTGSMLLSKLEEYGFLVTGDDVPRDIGNQVLPVAIQCFSATELKKLTSATSIPLVYLVSSAQAAVSWNKESLTEIKTFASSIAPEKSFFTTANYSATLSDINLAREVGLAMHPWTFRIDSGVGTVFNGDYRVEEEYYICCLGIDGFFTEFTDRSREDIDAFSLYEEGTGCSINCSSY